LVSRADGIELNGAGYAVFGTIYGGLGLGAGAGIDALIGGPPHLPSREHCPDQCFSNTSTRSVGCADRHFMVAVLVLRVAADQEKEAIPMMLSLKGTVAVPTVLLCGLLADGRAQPPSQGAAEPAAEAVPWQGA
jgi:hypothetical protein